MECRTNVLFLKGSKIYNCWGFFYWKKHNKNTWRYMNDISFSNSLFRNLVFFISYSSMMRSFITLLVVGTFLFAGDGCPVILRSRPCLCDCFDLLTLCQNRCNTTMTDSGQRSRCMSSCGENYNSCNRSCRLLPG